MRVNQVGKIHQRLLYLLYADVFINIKYVKDKSKRSIKKTRSLKLISIHKTPEISYKYFLGINIAT
ncbi:MAG: hypothetical protein APR54_04600 [Candidatus Cloacimonas sp. SDB]|nr:MAG: hypothetical protein APR54_04600 [Candidatus Cloacimonas sp. SDB]